MSYIVYNDIAELSALGKNADGWERVWMCADQCQYQLWVCAFDGYKEAKIPYLNADALTMLKALRAEFKRLWRIGALPPIIH